MQVMRPLILSLGSDFPHCFKHIKGLSILCHVTPQLFAPQFTEKIAQLMQKIVSSPPRWLTSFPFLMTKMLLHIAGSVISHYVKVDASYSPLNVYSLLLEPAIAAEAIMRQCASSEFQASFSLVPTTAFILSQHASACTQLLVRYSNKQTYPLKTSNEDTNKKLILLQQQIVQEITDSCAPCTRRQMRQLSVAPAKTERQDLWESLSDLKLVCGDTVFHVHACMVYPESTFLQTNYGFALSAKAAALQEVHLDPNTAFELSLALDWVYAAECALDITIKDSECAINEPVTCASKHYAPTVGIQTLSMTFHQALSLLQLADFMGMDKLVQEIIYALNSKSLLTVQTVSRLTQVANDLMAVPMAAELYRACQLFTVQRGFEMSKGSLLPALLALDHMTFSATALEISPASVDFWNKLV